MARGRNSRTHQRIFGCVCYGLSPTVGGYCLLQKHTCLVACTRETVVICVLSRFVGYIVEAQQKSSGQGSPAQAECVCKGETRAFTEYPGYCFSVAFAGSSEGLTTSRMSFEGEPASSVHALQCSTMLS
eukprot:GHVQ01031908.1.p1 GENE.GHVQ01031908.1~~GHVQ01031908.1.p1  ORF type:complete len:129 (+),score=5.92 GHVQ01031908.1:832-1218(+)